MLVTLALNFKYSYIRTYIKNTIELQKKKNVFISFYFVLFENVILFEKNVRSFSKYDDSEWRIFQVKNKTNYNEENNNSLSQLNMN